MARNKIAEYFPGIIKDPGNAFKSFDSTAITDAMNIADFAAGGITAVATALQAFIRPKEPPLGIAGYLFNIVESDTVEFSSDITDHVVSNNTTVQDHITNKPETITVKGLVAEVYETAPMTPGLDRALAGYDALHPYVQAYLPQFDANALKALNEATRLDRMASTMVKQYNSIYDIFREKGWKAEKINTNREMNADAGKMDDYNSYRKATGDLRSRQIEAFEFFRFLWANRLLVTIETAWGIYENMAIKSLKAVQDANTTRYMTSFEMSFKKIHVVVPRNAEKSPPLSGGAQKAVDDGKKQLIFNTYKVPKSNI